MSLLNALKITLEFFDYAVQKWDLKFQNWLVGVFEDVFQEFFCFVLFFAFKQWLTAQLEFTELLPWSQLFSSDDSVMLCIFKLGLTIHRNKSKQIPHKSTGLVWEDLDQSPSMRSYIQNCILELEVIVKMLLNNLHSLNGDGFSFLQHVKQIYRVRYWSQQTKNSTFMYIINMVHHIESCAQGLQQSIRKVSSPKNVMIMVIWL